MESESNYYQPKPDPKQYQEAIIKATFLVDNCYVRLSEGLTFELLVESLLKISPKI